MSAAQPEPPAASAPSSNFSFRRVFKSWGVLACSSTLAVTLIALCARWSPIAEITSHFRALYLLAALAALACLLIARSWRWGSVAVVLVLCHGWALAAWYVPAAAASAGGKELKVMTSNVNADTHDYARLLDVIAKENPDLIFVQELSQSWAKALEPIHEKYPYRIVTARADYFGLGFYSRYPIEGAVSNDPVESDVPISRGDVLIDGHRVHIVNAHLAPPEGSWLTVLRYRQFAWLTKYLETHKGPVIVAGDFNCTMWSPLYHDLVEHGRLSNARQGHGVLASWYTLPGSLNVIPIDHILGGGVQFTGAHLGGRIGSDHVPVVATLTLPK